MVSLVAFDLDGTLALSKQPLDNEMAEALATLLQVAHVAIISGGDWPQFEKQIAARLSPHADRSKLFLLPTTGTKLYTFSPESNEWNRIYADLFTETQKSLILSAFDAALAATSFTPEKT
ncbi:hypothetical protein BDW59DRAFT_160824 [Aspergillus cavernicola]|uniref:Phosphomannomutase n=1 Tax=Aspergillus cavernicola TaxID=176166 RepID=A0ABR4IFT8_9EURO